MVACETLNDTGLRKNFRRKNTARKSFLEHARLLHDLPIEAAMARPTQRFAAHRGSFVGPRPGPTSVSKRRGGDDAGLFPFQWAVQPPSIGNATPVIEAAASLARKRVSAPSSSTVAKRLFGC